MLEKLAQMFHWLIQGIARISRAVVPVFLQVLILLIAVNMAFSGLWRVPPNAVVKLVERFLPAMLIPGTTTLARAYWILVLLILALYWVSLSILRRRGPKVMQVRTASGGTLVIHRGAILKFVRAQVENHPAVLSQKIEVTQSGSRGLSIDVRVKLQSPDRWLDIQEQLEKDIRDGFLHVMGIEKIDRLDVAILDFDDKKIPAHFEPGPAVRPKPKPEPPIRGTIEVAEAEAAEEEASSSKDAATGADKEDRREFQQELFFSQIPEEPKKPGEPEKPSQE